MGKTSCIAAAVAAVFAPVVAAQQAPADSEAKKTDIRKVEKIEVTASPLGRAESELAQPATVLDPEELRRKRAASIGDTLSQELGVQSSAFGPGSGRPIIRGLDGPRVRVLENGIGTLDASTVSPDHMVASETLHAEQIEILRGPASLLYGSGAIGGIVNVVSSLIPRTRSEGFHGDLEGRMSSANRERTLGANLNGSGRSVAWHLDAFARRTRDYEIPGPAVRGKPDSPSGRLPDSFVRARGGGAGASFFGGRGYIGAGVSRLESEYGIPSGEGTRIDLRQTRFESAGEMDAPFALAERVKFRAGHGDYEHREIERSGEVATMFRNKATEARMELRHVALGALSGTLGIQWQDQKRSALGEEAVLPPTRSRGTGVFVVEQLEHGAWTFDAGVRYERETRDPAVAEWGAERFGNAIARRFSLFTPALGVVLKLAGGHRLAVSATQAQRAPSVEELYSNGPHHATATFDIGDPLLGKEISRNIDVTLRKAEGDIRWRANFFVNNFRDYVYGRPVDLDGDGLPDAQGDLVVQRFTQVRARFRGVEAEWRYRPSGGPYGVRAFGDVVRARLDDGTHVPRIAPARIGGTLDLARGRWTGYVTAIHAFDQKRTAPLETPAAAYTRIDAGIAFRLQPIAGQSTTFFAQGTNLLDEEIRVHGSHLKDVAPLMGRSFTLGLRGEF